MQTLMLRAAALVAAARLAPALLTATVLAPVPATAALLAPVIATATLLAPVIATATLLAPVLVAATLLAPVTATAAAERFPDKPVRLIVPFTPGGTFDFVGRTIAHKLTDMWGQQVVVDNRPGAGTMIATELVVNATPDGHTLLLASTALAANPSLHKTMPYDAEKALATVSLLAAQPMALGAHPSFPAKSIADLIKLAKSKPHSLSYGTAGIGSGGYLAGEIMKSMAGVDIVHIGYKGGNNAMVDVMANQIPLVFTGLPNLLPQMKAGKIAILGITGAKRSPVAPDIPTIGETVPGYHFDNWFGLVAPRGTPAAVLARLDTDSNAALRTPEVKNRLLTAGFVLIGISRRAFAKTLKEDTVTFADVIRKAGLVVN